MTNNELYKNATTKFYENKFEEALSIYFKILSEDLNNYAMYYNIALTYEMLGEMELAVANYKKAIGINPKDVRSINNLARIFLEYIKDEKTACEYLDYAIETVPSDAEAYNIYGNIYFNKQKYKTAKLYFQKSINFDKNFYKNYYDIAKAYIGMDDYENAKQSLNTCLELKPDNDLAKKLLSELKG